jgi:UDP-N-acetylglucosamine 2-epimerase (non-hydrolysing)
MTKRKVMLVAGARPNFMKVAPLSREFQRRQGVESVLVHTGQHYDVMMSEVFFRELEIPHPDINLEVGSHPREEQIGMIAERFDPVVRDTKPDVVIVVGDVNSTVACAQVARRYGVKVAHVEAGLRSFDLRMPEELNRTETDKLADFLFVTEPSGMEHLAAEGVPGRRFLVGNVMIDTLVGQLDKVRASGILAKLSLRPREYVAATFHRPSNVDTKDALGALVGTIAAVCDEVAMVLPIHPRTLGRVKEFGLEERLRGIELLVLCDPLGYHDFMKLVMDSQAVVTDSGGIQEETTYLGIPCITMRENTERPITVEVGTNVVVGADRGAVLAHIGLVRAGALRKGRVPELWDGGAAERIAEILIREMGEAASASGH